MSASEPDCEVLKLLYDAELCEKELALRAGELQQLAIIEFKGEPDYATRAVDLFGAVAAPTTDAVPHMVERIKQLEAHYALLTARRAEQLDYDVKVAEFEATVQAALELTSFPVPTLDTADDLLAIQSQGEAQVDGLTPPPEGASGAARVHAAELILTWREIFPAISQRAAEAEGAQGAALQQERLLRECLALKLLWAEWEARNKRLLSPDAPATSADPEDVRLKAELALATILDGAACQRAQLRALLASFPAETARPAARRSPRRPTCRRRRRCST